MRANDLIFRSDTYLDKSKVPIFFVFLTTTLLNACAATLEGVTKRGLQAAPHISGPSSSTGTYTISWAPQNRLEYARLKERNSSTSWKTPIKVSGKSKTYHNKPDGTYKYRVKTCFWDSESKNEFCSPYSAIHTVIVSDPFQVLDRGRTIVSRDSMFSANLPDLDKDGLADSWENKIAFLSMPHVRLDEEEDLLDHPEHHIVDFVRVVPIVKDVSNLVPSVKTTESTTKSRWRPKITGPKSSTGTYTISWAPQHRLEYAKLQEWTCRRGWEQLRKIRGKSKTYHNKADGTYRYRVKTCFWDSESKKEFCSSLSAVHTVSVDNPAHLGYLIVIHAFSWSRDYGRFTFVDHNGDVERVTMLWKIINDKRISLEYIHTTAHGGESNDHSGVWRACEGCMSCNYGDVTGGSPQRLCIESLQFESNRLRIRASEDKHAIYPRKKLCEDVVLVDVPPNIHFGEDCGDGPLLGTTKIKVFNVGEPWADGQLIDRLNDHSVLRNIFPNEEIWIEASNMSANKFCGGLGFKDNCPTSVGSKLVVPSELLQRAGVCGAAPGVVQPRPNGAGSGGSSGTQKRCGLNERCVGRVDANGYCDGDCVPQGLPIP